MAAWIEIAAGAAGVGSGVLVALALGRGAKRADEPVEGVAELSHIAATLERLSDERSAAGTPFFPTPGARRELAEQLYTVLDT